MHYDVQLLYEDFSLHLAEASVGIQKLFGLLCALTEATERGVMERCMVWKIKGFCFKSFSYAAMWQMKKASFALRLCAEP